ncbi:MAG: hypothetical protein HC933_08135 [Pleurocapsa sp. SU_196_0]|nr:hypothetical protein [Pleurocapsa sp. SU_196_0]
MKIYRQVSINLLVTSTTLVASLAMSADLIGRALTWVNQITGDISATKFNCAPELRAEKTKAYFCGTFDDDFKYFKTQWDAFTSTRAELEKLDFKALIPWTQNKQIFYRKYRFNYKDTLEVRFTKPYFIVVYTKNTFK